MTTLTPIRLTRPRGSLSDAVRVLLIAAALVLAAALVPAPRPALAAADVQPARAGGETRLETAAAVAGRAFPQGASQAVIASALRFGDALAGAALAGALDAPMLLTTPERLEAPTADALRALDVERVTLLGGTAILQPAVAQDLARLGIATDRIGDDDVVASAAAIARATEFVAGDLPRLDGQRTAAVASARDFPDALAISGPAAELAMPLLLTDPDDLSPEVAATLDGLDPEQVLVVGGPDAVSEAVVGQIAQGTRAQVTRLGGINRNDTAAIVADHFIDAGVLGARSGILARGDAFPDAVTAGQLSAFLDAPILLTVSSDTLGEITGQWFVDRCPTLELLQVVGGTAAVSVEAANGAEGLAESCDTPAEEPTTPPEVPTTGQTFVVAPQQGLSATAPATHDFTVSRRYDGQPLTQRLDLVLFPCANADILGAGDDVFADADDDDRADGFATTETGSARIAVVNGDDVDDTVIFTAAPDEDGDIDIRLASAEPDCVVLVVVDGNGNGALDLDEQDRPIEAYGVGRAEWTAG